MAGSRNLRHIYAVKELAQERTLKAINTLTEIMEDKDAPHASRVAAAVHILDRGWGKPQQTIEANVTHYDGMDLNELKQLFVGKVLELTAGEATDVVSDSEEAEPSTIQG